MQTTGYALTALGHLAQATRPMLIREIAEQSGIPREYLGKLINTLARKGYVSTQRGKGGGVILAADPDSTSLYEICSALDDPIVKNLCMLGTASCSDERNCPCHAFWREERAMVTAFLQQRTLADIGRFQAREEAISGLKKETTGK